jgi:hypothetical protein
VLRYESTRRGTCLSHPIVIPSALLASRQTWVAIIPTGRTWIPRGIVIGPDHAAALPMPNVATLLTLINVVPNITRRLTGENRTESIQRGDNIFEPARIEGSSRNAIRHRSIAGIHKYEGRLTTRLG